MQFERPQTITEYLAMFHHIFGEQDKQYTNDQLVLRLFERVADGEKLARKDYRKKFKVQLPVIFRSLASVVNRHQINLQEALWLKYPGVCTYCFSDFNCTCAAEHPRKMPNKEFELDKKRQYRNGGEQVTLREHWALHKRLYRVQNKRIFPIQISAHITEEVGEISVEFRKKNMRKAAIEMADECSWLFALSVRLWPKIPFDDLIWRVYPYQCNQCHQDVCIGGCEEKTNNADDWTEKYDRLIWTPDGPNARPF